MNASESIWKPWGTLLEDSCEVGHILFPWPLQLPATPWQEQLSNNYNQKATCIWTLKTSYPYEPFTTEQDKPCGESKPTTRQRGRACFIEEVGRQHLLGRCVQTGGVWFAFRDICEPPTFYSHLQNVVLPRSLQGQRDGPVRKDFISYLIWSEWHPGTDRSPVACHTYRLE